MKKIASLTASIILIVILVFVTREKMDSEKITKLEGPQNFQPIYAKVTKTLIITNDTGKETKQKQFALFETSINHVEMATFLYMLFNILFYYIKMKQEYLYDNGRNKSGFIWFLILSSVAFILFYFFIPKELNPLSSMWSWVNLPNILLVIIFIVVIVIYHVKQFMEATASELVDDY